MSLCLHLAYFACIYECMYVYMYLHVCIMDVFMNICAITYMRVCFIHKVINADNMHLNVK